MKRVIAGIILLALLTLSFGCGAPEEFDWSKVEIITVDELPSPDRGVRMFVLYRYEWRSDFVFINKEDFSKKALREAIAAKEQERQEAEQKLEEFNELLQGG